MRNTFAQFLSENARADAQIRLLTGDLGYGLFEEFQKTNPKSFINCGIAEANMIGVAAGLALTKKTPFVYSIAPFLILRALEQIKMDVAVPHLNVKLVGVGAGVDYCHAGVSHYSLEDIGVISSLPNFRIYNPSDKEEVKECLREMLSEKGPCYLRLANCVVPDRVERPRLSNNKVICLNPGKDIVIFSTGTKSNHFFHHKEFIFEQAITFVHIPVIAPPDSEEIYQLIKNARYVFSIEDQYELSGVDLILTKVISRKGLPVIYKHYGFRRLYNEKFGDRDYLNKLFGSQEVDLIEEIKTIRNNLSNKL